MKKVFVISAVFIFLFFYVSILTARAANSSDVVINEIAWMGTTNSANDEWMELKNNTANQIDLSGWSIQSADEKLKINLKNAISANGFYLTERTDDTSVPNITADLIYTGALSNSGMDLKLYDNLNNLIDEVNCAGKWFAGDNITKQTMEQVPPGSWQTSQAPGGSPRAQNSAVVEDTTTPETTTTGPTTAINKAVETTPAIVYPTGVVINEVLPNPEGPDETDEWIELYNSNNSDVDLSNWQVQDTTGTITTYTIPSGTKILANGFLVFKRPETKIMLNNDVDGLNLNTPDGKIIDTVSYTKAPLNQSYNKASGVGPGGYPGSWAWSATLTPGAKNIISSAGTLSKANNFVKNNSVELGLADISRNTNLNQDSTSGSPWFLFFTVLATTIILAAIVLFTKFKLKKNLSG